MRVLLSETEIGGRVAALAGEIVQTVPPDFTIVGLLKGAAVFVADLMRALDRAGARPEIEFLRLGSYGPARESSGEVRLFGEVPPLPAGRPVLVVDDIADSGRSLAYAVALVRRQRTGRLWTCALIDKPGRRQVEVAVDFVGFTIGDDDFVVGYGTDLAEKYRHLPYIGIAG
jgi:hypoxanthine phosphoribosyltransferase